MLSKEAKEVREIMSEWEFNPHVKLVKICWKDAQTMVDSLSLSEVVKQKLAPAQSIGYLLHEDDDVYIICSYWFWDEETDILDEKGRNSFRYVHTIPKSLVDNILVLKIDLEESKKFRENIKGEKDE